MVFNKYKSINFKIVMQENFKYLANLYNFDDKLLNSRIVEKSRRPSRGSNPGPLG